MQLQRMLSEQVHEQVLPTVLILGQRWVHWCISQRTLQHFADHTSTSQDAQQAHSGPKDQPDTRTACPGHWIWPHNLLAAKWKQCGNYGTGPIAPKALPTLEQCSEHNSVQGATSCYSDWALFSSIQDISIVVLAATAAKRRSHKYLYYGSPDTLFDRPRYVLWLSSWCF